MKKYKLIKEYPGSPELGTTKLAQNISIEGEYPEFWKEAVEKDYEILATRLKKSGIIISKGNFSKPGYCGNNETIHSVKRVSDGEVFTVDKYVENTQYPQKHRGKITKFILDGDTVRVYYSNGWDRLKYISNCKQPLFTTEDGVKIFEGDRIYWQSPMTGNIVDCTIDSKEDLLFNTEGRKFFSTKEAVEEHVLMNKPCLSYEEIMEQIPFTDKDREIQKNLKELVKSKLE